ncbi:MAG: hypothetical protein KKF12_19240 [Proteobacteria bacterium]|nr:hypothetical protein [Desulfobacula sp.]MBU3950663.1 hypothetical protein [Pseudomonadota bacterium]MBU4132959.1 hypothetical protein [Pseudomonadota bacterium]
MITQKLIDKYLPKYSFNEYHETIINNSIDNVYEKARNFDLSKSNLIRWLFKIRGLPTKRMHLQDFISDIGFTTIEENSPIENLIGFWARYKIEPITSPYDFINDTTSARVKVVWNFYLEELNSNQVRLSTETRILCMTPSAKVTFGLYWMIIKPFSGVIRNKMLQIIKQDLKKDPENG